VQLTIDVSTYMTSTERIFEFCDIEQEQSVVSKPAPLMPPKPPAEDALLLAGAGSRRDGPQVHS
jgi:hypothetical protein